MSEENDNKPLENFKNEMHSRTACIEPNPKPYCFPSPMISLNFAYLLLAFDF